MTSKNGKVAFLPTLTVIKKRQVKASRSKVIVIDYSEILRKVE
jgi:hypothetical protein